MENSSIEWTTHTFNPWIGCSKCSAGCEFCYAKSSEADRFGRVIWGPSGTRMRTSANNWKQPLKWNRDAEGKSEKPRVFCASLSDVFEDYQGDGLAADRPLSLDPWRIDLFDLIEKTPNLEWLLLTKRPEIAYKFLKDRHFDNVWIGTSVENQKAADERIPLLAKIPAKIRFLSCEPLIGPLDLSPYLDSIDWVIVGGESGRSPRPIQESWVLSLRDQCLLEGIAFFFKQWGGRNKKAAGRELDGMTWNGLPVSMVSEHEGNESEIPMKIVLSSPARFKLESSYNAELNQLIIRVEEREPSEVCAAAPVSVLADEKKSRQQEAGRKAWATRKANLKKAA